MEALPVAGAEEGDLPILAPGKQVGGPVEIQGGDAPVVFIDAPDILPILQIKYPMT